MNWLDFVVLIVWGVTALYGWRVGLFRMLVPLVVVVAGLALSSRISGSVGNLFSSFTANENIQTIAAFLVIFIAVFIAGAIVSFWLRMVLRFVPFFGIANGAAGAVVGLAVGFVLLSGMLTASQKFPVGNMETTIQESRFGSFLADNFSVVIRAARVIPVDWDAKVEDIKDVLPEGIPTALPDNLPRSIPELLPLPNLDEQIRPQNSP